MSDVKCKWFEENPGEISAMRIIAVPSTYVGLSVLIAAVFAMFFKFDGAAAFAGIGAGLATTGMGLKWAQKTAEVKAQ